MSLQLHNTLSGQKEQFEPLDPDRVTIYLCGPTVYNYAHIGNARPAVVVDVLLRLLRREYPKVVFARNITDVDDKINKRASDEGVDIGTIARRYHEIYNQDLTELGVAMPDVEPRATDHIRAMIEMITTLIEAGHAYESGGHVLFAVDTFDSYGALSKRSTDEQQAGARVEVEDYKRNPGDFVLWKPSSDDLPGWDSPWGRGRPGWHIECSAMARQHLGTTVDIHAGGQDLIFPHHENERAQSQCAHGGETFVRYWLHNGFLTANRQKMSKSVGNISTIHELLEHYPGEALRYLLLSAQYRQPLDWSEDAVQQAVTTLSRLYGTLQQAQENLPETNPEASHVDEQLLTALKDDLNTPRALARLNQLSRDLREAGPEHQPEALATLLASARLLGLLQQSPSEWFQALEARKSVGHSDQKLEQIESLVARRAQARQDKNFAEADRIRDQLAGMGVVVEDSGGQSSWHFE